QKAGLLAGRRATTHWRSLERLGGFPSVTVCQQRFVHDDNIWTSAGISAGIDMALAFIASVAGNDVAGRVQLNCEFYPDTVVYQGDVPPAGIPRYVVRTNRNQ